MLGFPILYFKGRRLTMFQLSGFYCRGLVSFAMHRKFLLFLMSCARVSGSGYRDV